MPYISFHDVCPEIAEKETRVITFLRNDNEFNLPCGDYFFVELFCDECDCRRVFLQVIKGQKVAATIAYGWEKRSFYRREFKGFGEDDINELKGPCLPSFQIQSDISKQVFKMFNKILFSDKKYMDRITKHYSQFKRRLRTTRR